MGLIGGFAAQALSAEYLEGSERQKSRAYSPAVITEGGRTVWLAGQLALADAEGRSLADNFEGQVREIFRQLDLTLKRAGGSLRDMVIMTVFINDPATATVSSRCAGSTFPTATILAAR